MHDRLTVRVFATGLSAELAVSACDNTSRSSACDNTPRVHDRLTVRVFATGLSAELAVKRVLAQLFE